MSAEMYQFPLKQHIGKEAVPCVVKGDRIKRGQPLAVQQEGTLGAAVYSSITGVVEEVTPQKIVVRQTEAGQTDYVKLEAGEPLELIQRAGIVGLGGAGFPTYAKLTKPFEGDGMIIINAAECEPILDHNMVRIAKNPRQLLRGLEILMEVTGATRGVIAIKGIHDDVIRILEPLLEGRPVHIVKLPNLYPVGEERAVVREVTGKLLGINELPLAAGAIVVNAETACRVQEAVDLRKPLIDKDMTVAGKIKGNEQDKLVQVFLDVPLGTSIAAMFERAGGLAEGYGEIIEGGPFTGKRTELDRPVTKTTGGLIASECFMKGPERMGILVCACCAGRERLEQLAESMGSQVVDVQYCKQAHEVRGSLKCENPGRCPGQIQKVLALKKAGAQGVLIGNCSDCTNTVMSCAPKLGLPVYHCTDGALRAVNYKLYRKLKK